METLRDDWHGANRRALKPLKVLVVGAGIAGLSTGLALSQTGHTVTILESVPEVQEVGAGIQLASNASRILHRLGVLKEVMDYATVLERVSIRRYDNDEEMGTAPLMPSVGYRYGAPMSVIHRGDLQRILLRAAESSGCQILTSHRVVAVDPEFRPLLQVHRVKTNDLVWFSGDLVIAADGTKSALRRQMTRSIGFVDNPIDTGDAAYRLLIPRERVLHEPELLAMMDQNVAMRYMGPHGHVMAYPIRNNTVYNIVLLHPSGAGRGEDENSWTRKGDYEAMLRFYDNWSPALRKWLQYADKDIFEWNLYIYSEIPSWVQGSVALVGDACHPMLPYVAQGAANAMEDAAVLATALTCTADKQAALGIYELVRKARGESIANSASANAITLHLPDGPEQRKRDEAIRNEGLAKEQNPDKWNDRAWQDYMWGVDVMEETLKKWTELVGKTRIIKLRNSDGKRRFSLPSNLSPPSLADLGEPRDDRLQTPWTKTVVPLAPWQPHSWRSKPIKQNPAYPDGNKFISVAQQLSRLPPVVHSKEVLSLRNHLKDVAQGKAFLLQGGDCAELFEYCQQDVIESKMKLLHQMSLILTWATNKRVVRVGRIAGQYAKPRSAPTEIINGEEYPSFRGDIFNGNCTTQRELDPDRLLMAYFYSSTTVNWIRALVSTQLFDREGALDWNMGHVRDTELKGRYTGLAKDVERMNRFLLRVAKSSQQPAETSNFFTSHEGLLLAYEEALTRPVEESILQAAQLGDSENKFYDSSAHFLWIGDRTRQIDHAHVEFFRGIVNPIGIKVGPTTPPSDVLVLLRLLNPACEPGKVTLITRLGADRVGSLLPGIIRTVENSEYHSCVVWQCDPMHGNTESSICGTKTRHFDRICRELTETLRVHKEQGSYLGGLHLELTSEAVTECLGGGEQLGMEDLGTNYTSACDPRLNEKQALELAFVVADHFSQEDTV